jgi:hypothetical protein
LAPFDHVSDAEMVDRRGRNRRGRPTARPLDSCPGSGTSVRSKAYDNQRVRLEGTASALNSTVSHRGNPYYSFVLDAKRGAVVVFQFGSPRCPEGQRATVEGVFHHLYERGGKTFTDEIDAEFVNCE